MADLAKQRAYMVEHHIAARGVRSPLVLEAMGKVPREEFLPSHLREYAYEDTPLPIGEAQTISQPYIVAFMTEALGLSGGEKVLEIGAGSGYAAAVIGQVAREVVAIERHPELVGLAKERMRRLGYANVRIVEGDGTRGCPAEAPFDAIVAAASGSHIPAVLIDQLKSGGRIVMPVGDPHSVQSLVKLTKHTDGQLEREDLCAVRFVPLIGEHGFRDESQNHPVRTS
jgi:protein-L-isoaspartate(D-aspartate) O-methyltransferase